jgi:hypothetical protein
MRPQSAETVRSSAWLGQRLIIALARDHLTATNRTTLNIAACDVKLTLENRAIVTRLSVCAPIVSILSVAHPLTRDSGDGNVRLQLRCLDLLRPTFDHANALVDDKLLTHWMMGPNDPN